jgi:hypothetical protein
VNSAPTRRLLAWASTLPVISAVVCVAAAGPAAADDDDYYPPITQNLSEAQVETMKENMDKVDDICDVINLPYLAGLACRNSPELEDVVNRAYYNDRGLVGKFYIHKGITSLNHYEWEMSGPTATAPEGGGPGHRAI